MFENQQLYEQLNELFFSYEHVESTTWLYLTTLLSIAVFFKFGRFFSMRNLDILLLSLFSPCFMLVSFGITNGFEEIVRLGYVTLWVMGGIFMLRMFYDCTMVRRPLLEPNLSAGGLSFLVFALFVLLVSNVSLGTYRVMLRSSEISVLRRCRAIVFLKIFLPYRWHFGKRLLS